ncbi:MAG: glycosyl hydrolase 53 family protein [Planctomycetota bacterium]
MVNSSNEFELGVDVSLLARLEAAGARFSDCPGVGAASVDPLRLLRDAGFTTARLRLFHTPTGRGAQVNDLAYTLELAKRCVAAGFEILLCPHFSDTWADPGRQRVPAAWAGLDLGGLCAAVRTYTADVLRAFDDAGCRPATVQVGNEITGGFLWDAGRVARTAAATNDDWSGVLERDESKWVAFASLLCAAIAGIEDGCGSSTEIMLHIDRGGDEGAAACFFEWMNRYGVRYDRIGLSYYPFWHGSLESLCGTVTALYRVFGRPVHVVETAFPAERHPVYGVDGGVEAEAKRFGTPPTHAVDYPLTEAGQHAFVSDLLDAMREHGDRGWRGVSYWAPEWIPVHGHADEPDAETCWPRALFDRGGGARPALEAFRRFAAREAGGSGVVARGLGRGVREPLRAGVGTGGVGGARG